MTPSNNRNVDLRIPKVSVFFKTVSNSSAIVKTPFICASKEIHCQKTVYIIYFLECDNSLLSLVLIMIILFLLYYITYAKKLFLDHR